MSEFIVAVKSEYLMANRPLADPVPVVTTATDDHPNPTAAATDGDNQPASAVDSADTAVKVDERRIDARDSRDNRDRDNGGSRNKKRPRDTRVPQSERLCSSVNRGEQCRFGQTCPYSHDPLAYLASKGPDVGAICYQFEQFGWCNNGISCAYGNAHIDLTNGKNLTRSQEAGGCRDRVLINNLPKVVQCQLRKKSNGYDFSSQKNGMQSAVTVLSAHGNSNDENDIGNDDDKQPVNTEVGEAEKSVDIVENLSKITKVDASDSAVSVAQEEIEKEGDKEDAAGSSTKAVDLTASLTHGPDTVSCTPDLSAYDSFVKIVDFSNKVYIAPLTTVGNLPFRRVLKDFGADITCGEMAMSNNLMQGQSSEWALLRRHPSESFFGMQIACGHSDQATRIARLLENETSSTFVDLNCGCPIDVVCNRGCGSGLLNNHKKLCSIVGAMTRVLTRPLTVKIRTGWNERTPDSHLLVPKLQQMAGGKIAAIMVHGRSRLQRYHRLANWEYILQVARSQSSDHAILPVIGNGDILSWEDWESHRSMIRSQTDESLSDIGLVDCAMLGRGALMKPWLPKEIKERRHIDISASERMDMLKSFCNYGLEHWGSDQQGINTTRRFLLEWLSFLHRYVPVGLTESSQKMNQRPPHYFGRCDLETLMASSNCIDWVRISELLLGPVPDSFQFLPKHKSNSYSPEGESVSNG